MKKKALTKEAFGHHLSKVAQLKTSMDALLAEARQFEKKADQKYREAARLERRLFKIIDKDFVDLYNRLTGENDGKKTIRSRKDTAT